MRDINKILTGSDANSDYNCGIITTDSMILYGGKVGAKYVAKTKMYTALAEKHGNFAIPYIKDFLAKIKLLDNIDTVTINEEHSTMLFKFGKNSKIEFPVILNVEDTYPHTAIPWIDFIQDKETLIPLSKSFHEMAGLLTNEGTVLWQDDIGITISGEKMLSFDLGVFMFSNLRNGDCNVFVPKSLLDLHLEEITHVKKVQNGVILCGNNVQYYAPVLKDGIIPEELSNLVDKFNTSEKKDISFTFSNTLWKRVSSFNKQQMNIKIQDGTMSVSSDSWEEELGKLNIEDCTFSASVSLIRRWMRDCIQQGLSIDEDGNWLLKGQLHNGGNFYGITTTHSNSGFSQEDAGFDIFADEDDEGDNSEVVDDDESDLGDLI